MSVALERSIAAELSRPVGDLGSVRVSGGGGRVADSLAAAFGTTFWWAVGLTALGLIPAMFLPRHPAVARRPPAVEPEPA